MSSAFGYGVMNLLMTATPLAMGLGGHPYDDATNVMSAHGIAMFAPSFFTGTLIQRVGVLKAMLAGVALMGVCLAVSLSGVSVVSPLLVAGIAGAGLELHVRRRHHATH
jgi:MFS family permease